MKTPEARRAQFHIWANDILANPSQTEQHQKLVWCLENNYSNAHRAGMLEAANKIQERIEVLEALGDRSTYETAIHELRQRKLEIETAANAKP